MNQPMHALASAITEKFIAADPKGAAQALATLATHEVLLLVGGLKAQSLISVLNPMDPPKAAAILRRLPLKQSSYVLTHLAVPQAAKLWKEFATPYQERLKSVLEPAFIELVQSASGFDVQSVGNAMRTDFVAVRTETKVGELVSRLKNLPRKKLPLVCFVTDKNGALKGALATAELAFFNVQAVCGSVMTPVRALQAQDEIATVKEIFLQEDVLCLPVINAQHVIIGALDRISVLSIPPAKKTLWKRLTK